MRRPQRRHLMPRSAVGPRSLSSTWGNSKLLAHAMSRSTAVAASSRSTVRDQSQTGSFIGRRRRVGFGTGRLDFGVEEPVKAILRNPLLWNRMSKNKDRHSQRMCASPPIGEVECPPSRHQSPCRCTRLPKVISGLWRDLEHDLRARQSIFGVPLKYQAKSRSPPSPIGASAPSFGPAINPSSDVACPVRIFPMASFSYPVIRPSGLT